MNDATRTPACHRVLAMVVIPMTDTERAEWRMSIYSRATRQRTWRPALRSVTRG